MAEHNETQSNAAQSAGGQNVRKELARFLLEQVKQKHLPKEQALSFLEELAKTPAPEKSASQEEQIAIIGMACRFPKADNKWEFWQRLAAGQSCIGVFPVRRRDLLGALDNYETPLFDGGFLQDVERFDHEYFQIPPVVARTMDPYQRLMLEVLVETMEDAGYHKEALYGAPVGVFVGNDHTHRLVNSYLNFIREIDFNAITGSWTAVLASRLSYLFNFKGPALVTDTACSSGLVALDQACKALRNGDCETALVGAANLFFTPAKGLVGEIENTDYKVRAFDKGANGTVWGEGVAAVMLKPLSAALRDGDCIHAIVKGLAVNNDGASNGLTAPSAKAQKEVLSQAWRRAGIDPQQISYIETHGTGTQLGDPIEIKGISGAFEQFGARRQFCGIGSVKTNIGHTVGVAGLASLIKVVMALQQRQLPASLNFEQPNPFIDFAASPVYVVDHLQDWPQGAEPRLAGISSFSLSGTNCHVLLQEAPAQPRAAENARAELLILSARSPELLAQSLQRWLDWLQTGHDFTLADLCFTAAIGREQQACRAILPLGPNSGRSELTAGLQALLSALQNGAQHAQLQISPAKPDAGALSAMRAERNDLLPTARAGAAAALARLGQLWLDGTPLKWEELYQGRPCRRISLPGQVFIAHRFWDRPAAVREAAAPAAKAQEKDDDWVQEALQAPCRLAPEQMPAQDAAAWQTLAWVWSEALGYPQVKLEDDFYALGGDSIIGLKIIHVINTVCALELTIADLMSAPSLGAFGAKLLAEHNFASRLQQPQAAQEAIAPAQPIGHDTAGRPQYALSRAQTRMLLIERIAPGASAYNVHALVRLQELPDLAQTETLLAQLIARHDVLRCGYDSQSGDFRQTLYAAHELPPCQPILHHITPAAGQSVEQALHAAARAVVQPFDLRQPPLLRWHFFLSPDGACHMLLDMHHIATDGSSMGVLIAEFMALQTGHSLPVLPCQYQDFAAWQNQRFASGAYAAQQAYWLERFAGEIPVLDLQTDYPRPAWQDFKGARLARVLPLALAQGLRQTAHAHGASLFMCLLAGFYAMLWRIGAGADLVLGAPVAGRNRQELHNLQGMFVNTLALRQDVQEADSFASLLARVRSNVMQALAQQDYPYDELVEHLHLPRNTARNPLFDIYFVLQNEDMGLESGSVSSVSFDNGSAKFDITVILREAADGLHLEWEYATSLFAADSMQRMMDWYERILHQVMQDAQTPLQSLELLAAPEREHLLETLNDCASDFPRHATLAQLFAQQAARTPQAIALDDGEQRLTYAELEARSNRLAHWLRQAGVAQGELVALQFEPGFAMIESMLALFTIGAAYLPLDLDSPRERCHDILQQAGVKRLLCGGAGLLSLGEGLGLELIRPEQLDLQAYPATAPACDADGDSLAYVIFTSGSTGKPKGTLIRHMSAARVVCDANYITLSEKDCLLHASSYAFDGSIFNIWAALLHGGRLHLLGRKELTDMRRLAQIIESSGVTVFFMTTALFNALLDCNAAALRGLRHVLVGGEAASLRHMRRACELLGPGGLINVYGPTETTVFATAYPVQEASFPRHSVPIGRPLANTRCLVLDGQMRPQPYGVTGELYIGGPGVSLGYLGQPEITAQKFVDDPWRPGEKLYASGDLVKWVDDGVLQFLGRRDHQVKIRGYRIELGEIEALLLQHGEVKECLVTADANAEGRRSLAAWVVPQDPAHLQQADWLMQVRRHVAALLPEYMRPSAWCVLPAFPLNPNGKIDRRVLPPALAGAGETQTAPRNAAEQTLAQAFASALGLEQVGIEQNFFELGGDSIKAIQICARLQEQGVPMQVAQLFQTPTIAELAASLPPPASENTAAGALPDVPALCAWRSLSESRRQGLQAWLLRIALPELPVQEVLQQALDWLWRRHPALRLRLQEQGAAWAAVAPDAHAPLHSFAGALPALDNEAVQAPLRAALDHSLMQPDGASAVFGLWCAPDGESGMLWLLHPLACDGPGLDLLYADWQACLQAAQDGQNEPTAHAAELAAAGHALHSWAQEQALEALDFWGRLQELGALCTPRALRSFERHSFSHALPTALCADLQHDALRAYTSNTQDLALAALAQALQAWVELEYCHVLLQTDARACSALRKCKPGAGPWQLPYPLPLTFEADCAQQIRSCKQTQREYEEQGAAWAALRYLNPDCPQPHASWLAAWHPQVALQIVVPQAGRQLLAPLMMHYLHALELEIVLDLARAQVQVHVSAQLAKRAGKLPGLLAQALQTVAAHCLAQQGSEKSASDFSSKLAADELDSIFSDLNMN